jgi:hypothetical protein
MDRFTKHNREWIRGAVLLTMLVSLFFGQSQVWAQTQQSALTVTPDISEGNDFATRILGQPWDMSTAPYPDFQEVFTQVDPASFHASNGQWTFTTNAYGSTVMIHSFGTPPPPPTQKALKMGDSYPIDASKYKLLSYWMCSNRTDPGILFWFMKPSWTDQVQHAGAGKTIQGCKLYVFNLSDNSAWKGYPVGLRIDPVLNSGITLTLGWVRLTTIDLQNPVTISWSGGSSTGSMSIYIGTTCDAQSGTLVGSTSASSGKFTWGASLIPNGSAFTPYPLPESFEPGQYKVITLDSASGTSMCSDLTIHKAPILQFQKPSYFSGPDYATNVVGNSWGMDGQGDIESAYDISKISFADGIMTAITGGTGDPEIFFKVTQPIDTVKYHYVTFRMAIDGTRDVGQGSVERFLWWTGNPSLENYGTTDAQIIYEGWQTYSFDLSQAYMASGPGWTGVKNAFRFDPHEFPASRTVHLDYVTLTGDDTVPKGSMFPIVYQIKTASQASITFYRDTDKNPANGRIEIGKSASAQAQQAAASRANPLYLPLLFNGYPRELNLLTGDTWNWDTSSVPSGKYYISADVSDGWTTTTWVSDTPVVIQ